MAEENSKQKILIIDDVVLNIKTLTETLKSEYEICFATNGTEGLEIASADDAPDLVLLDIVMPGMDGYKVCRELKSKWQTRDIPVIFITAQNDEREEAKGFEMGAVDYIKKPFDPTIVKARVKTHLALKNAQQALEYHNSILMDAVKDRTRELEERVRELEQEIIKRKQAETALKGSEELHRTLVDNIKFGIAYINQDFKIRMVNAAEAERLKVYPDEVVGKSCFSEIGNRDSICPNCPGIQVMETGHAAETEMNGVSLDGNMTNLHLRAFPVLDANYEPAGFVEIIEDVTDRKKAEKEKQKLEAQLRQTQKMESLGTLAGGIAHDFNNILFGATGFTEMAQVDMDERGLKDSRASTCHEQVLIALKRGGDLVRQILTFSRQGENERIPLFMQTIIKEALKFMRGSLPSSIDIRQKMDSGCGAVLADPAQIHQILVNLCTNAYHAMGEDGGILDVSYAAMDVGPGHVIPNISLKQGRYACLGVTDSGHGMDEETRKRIFEPFFTTKEVGKGTGLGLSTVHGIVSDHDGEIDVDSTPGQGTSFRIFFPFCDLKEGPYQEEKTADEIRGNESILFVDDELQIVQYAKMALEDLGYDVMTSTSSIDALSTFLAAPSRFDVVVADQTMPNMLGSEMARQMLEIRPELPVILCTGFKEISSKEKAYELGIRECISKPVLTHKLAGSIRNALMAGPKR